uniref:F-box domain-containing protein n=1 Tax=Brassica oleracea TaxID=3712 RepID=A0A3P6FV42_BRAOL|nr:unnamed protein product [Brassica oleracea]
MLSHLPADLVEEILSRVPATSLKRLRSTCKKWNALFKDNRFIEKHLCNVPKQLRVLILEGCGLYPTSVDLNSVPPSIEFSDELSLNNSYNSEKVYIDTVFHCDGLLLCTTTEDELVVWNPCLGETRWIKQNNGCVCFRWWEPWFEKFNGRKTKCALGYENNQFFRSYKILMFWGGDLVDGFEIYDFNSNAWRVVNAPNCFVIRSHGVALKGNAYWNAYDDKDSDYLLSFDFTRERDLYVCVFLSRLMTVYIRLYQLLEKNSQCYVV